MPKPLAMTYSLIMQAFWKQVQKQGQKAFYRVITFILGQEPGEHPSQGLMHHSFPPQGATKIDVLATYLNCMALAEYISLKKTAEGSQKSINCFLDLF